MADLFATIADPTRRALLEALRDARVPLDVPTLVGAAGATRQSVNRHLLALKDAELVQELGDGPERSYALSAQPLLALEDWTASFLLGVPEFDDESGAYAAWAGAEVGGTIGRTVATSAHRVRSVIQEAGERVAAVVPEAVRRKLPGS